MSEKIKEYSNGEVTIVWKPAKCIHSANCVHGLGDVFQPKEKPWIKVDAASTDALINQVKECPSGALSFYMNEGGAAKTEVADNSLSHLPTNQVGVELAKNGPLLFHGSVKIKTADGIMTTNEGITAFCRCGGSGNKPYCDGSHNSNGFQG